MKRFVIVIFLFSKLLSASGKFKLDDFSISLEQLTSAPNHIWVNSGYTTVNPKSLSVLGVNNFFSPPLGTKGFNLAVSFKADSILINDGPNYGKGDVGLLYSSGTWFPHKIVRKGTYHQLKGNQIYSFAVSSELIPLFGEAGFMEKITIRNRSGRPVNIQVKYSIEPGELINEPLSKWGFSLSRWTASEAEVNGKNEWQNDKVRIALYEENKSTELQPNEATTAYVAIIAKDILEVLPVNVDFKELEKKSLEAWENRLEKYTGNIPALESDIPGLKEFYYGSIISGLICIWENDKYLLNPHVSTAGMDGGGTCSYLWDIAGYIPKMMITMLGPDILKIANQMVSIDLEKYYAFTLDGSGIGVKYSYSPSAFTNLVSNIFQILGPDKKLYEAAKKIIINDEYREDKTTHLIDYGEQHNLLEMRSTGWEHIIVSPNAERVSSLKKLAAIGKILDEPGEVINNWLLKAEVIKNSIQQNLWDKDKNWFVCIYPNGRREFVYSIQIFDAVEAGVCTLEMEKSILSHLHEGAYLGKYGVSSVSKEDSIHYEVVDTDWSGGGSYIGDGLQLALSLYEKGSKDLAWDILKRYFWMGENLIYSPQEIYVDKPKAPDHKRANEVVGLIGAETILFGTLGLQTNYDGGLSINPQPVAEGNIVTKGFCFKGNQIDVELSLSKLKITKNGKLLYEGIPKGIKIL